MENMVSDVSESHWDKVEAHIEKSHRRLEVALRLSAILGALFGVIALFAAIVDENGIAFIVGGSLIGLSITAAVGMVVIDISRDVKRIYFQGR